ncbi:uncharacterized protein RAG0_10851 [Rhynchosporium agropyri]|uniref:2EXR domain-containing protein n=1 Tax=Rhynchosporium agropyri TaxID=914238 RepID=A0A1E1L1I6_9HELO|nr:uncharacterized protein RAG0_10851 [Rhynchosporium agropyri]
MQRPRKFDPPWVDFYTRPCPWFVKQLTSFPQFSKLPREIQLTIWEHAQPRRQVVSINCREVDLKAVPDPDESPAMTLEYRRPSMIEACSDARAAGLRCFTPALNLYLPSPIRFNFDHDVLELDMHMMEWIASVHEDGQLPIEDTTLVKNLAISHYRRFRAEDIILVCQYFSGLESLMINEPEIDDSFPSAGMPKLLSPSEASFNSRYRWKGVEEMIKKKISNVRPKLDHWVPPLLLTGTDTQWASVAFRRRIHQLHVFPSARNSNLMDWLPSFNIPSLGYSQKFALASGQISSITYQRTDDGSWSLEGVSGLEMFNMVGWVFEDSNLHFYISDSDIAKGLDELDWGGRDDPEIRFVHWNRS